MEIKYTAEATSSGGGRDGAVKSSDSTIDLAVRMPQALGGDGKGTNPEQLFAAGYAACFNGAMRAVAKNEGITVPDDATVTAAVGIGPDDTSFGLAVTLTANLSGLDEATAKDLLEKAHAFCPYSKATRGNIDVTLEATV